MPYKNPTIRAIYICEDDFETIIESLNVTIKKCRDNAKKCTTGYASGASIEKARVYNEKADQISDLISRIGTEMI